jgi:hypothetical protein
MRVLLPLLASFVVGVGGSWVDPDTPKDSRTTDPMSPGDERQYQLVSHCLLVMKMNRDNSQFCSGIFR